MHHNCTYQNGDTSLVCLLRLDNYVQLLHKNGLRTHPRINTCMQQWHARTVLKRFCAVISQTIGRLFKAATEDLFHTDFTDLTHDKHVLAPNDALLNFGLDCLSQLHLILITEGCVQVTVTSSYSCLRCTLTQF